MSSPAPMRPRQFAATRAELRREECRARRQREPARRFTLDTTRGVVYGVYMQATTTQEPNMNTATTTPFIAELVDALTVNAPASSPIHRIDTRPNDWHGVDFHTGRSYAAAGYAEPAEWVRLYADDPEGCRVIAILFDARTIELTRAVFTCGDAARELTVEMAAATVTAMLEVLV